MNLKNFEPDAPKSPGGIWRLAVDRVHRGAAGNGCAFRREKEFTMKRYDLRTLIFLALCCDLGLFTKRLISPAANLVTDALHIPGGVGTSFSLMFLVVAAVVIGENGCAAIMGAVQSVIALSLGMVGSMGMLSAVGYILPGVLIDLLLLALKHTTLPMKERMVCVNAAAAVCASLTANVIVFRLGGAALLLYLCVSATTGTLCGWLGAGIVQKLAPVLGNAGGFGAKWKESAI
jgi:hypothetical protein